MTVVSILVSDLQGLLLADQVGLQPLIGDLRRPKPQRGSFSPDVLESIILSRYRDGIFHDLVKDIVALKNPEERNMWVHAAMKEGRDLRRWVDEYIERGRRRRAEYEQMGYYIT